VRLAGTNVSIVYSLRLAAYPLRTWCGSLLGTAGLGGGSYLPRLVPGCSRRPSDSLRDHAWNQSDGRHRQGDPGFANLLIAAVITRRSSEEPFSTVICGPPIVRPCGHCLTLSVSVRPFFAPARPFKGEATRTGKSSLAHTAPGIAARPRTQAHRERAPRMLHHDARHHNAFLVAWDKRLFRSAESLLGPWLAGRRGDPWTGLLATIPAQRHHARYLVHVRIMSS